MHELSIAAAILEVALGSAPGRRIAAVGVRVGHLRQVVPSALEFSFQLLAEETLASGAALALEPVAAVGVCRGCGRESELRAFPLRCAACGGLELEVVRGEEFAVEWVEVEEG
jgi:hydrogenase nickel incorporation protein HypA/HybF